jgi:hypothetical protein
MWLAIRPKTQYLFCTVRFFQCSGTKKIPPLSFKRTIMVMNSSRSISLWREKVLHKLCSTELRGSTTRPKMICPGTSKLACWRVQLWTASKVGRRGDGTATAQHWSITAGGRHNPPASTNGTIYAGGRVMSTASIEALVGAAYISQPPAQMVPFLLARGLYRPPAGIFTIGGFHMHPPTQWSWK